MTYQDLRREHPGKVCICRPALRSPKTHQVIAWNCVDVVDTVSEARELIERLALDGVMDVAAISTNKTITIENDLAIRYCRVFFGMEQLL